MSKNSAVSNQTIRQSHGSGVLYLVFIMNVIKRIAKVDCLKTLLLHLKFTRNQFLSFIIGWNTIIKMKKNSAISVYPSGRLTIGMNELNRRKTVLILEKYASLSILGKVSIFNGCRISVGEGATLTIGNNTYVNESSRIMAVEKITIGDACAISWNVTIIDSDMHSIVINNIPKPHTAPIFIGNKVWIGANVIILKGVTIGDNVVIAAGTLVNRNIPNNSLVMGNPMKVMKSSVKWEM